MAKQSGGIVLVGARVERRIIDRLDAIVARHARLGDGVIWTRSDVIRQALLVGMEVLEHRLAESPHGDAAERRK